MDFIRVNGELTISNAKITKILPNELLANFISACRLTQKQPTIQIRKKVGGIKYPIIYTNDKIQKMALEIEEFDKNVSKHFPMINGEELEFKTVRKFRYIGEEKILTDESDLSLVIGGRFDGGIEGKKRLIRRDLTFDNEETTEIDGSAMGITLAYKELLKEDVTNPYDIPGLSADERPLIKKVINIALGAKDEDQTKNAFIKCIKDEEIDIPFFVYENLTPEGKKRGAIYYTSGCPCPDAAKNYCSTSTSKILNRTLKKHRRVLELVWENKDFVLKLQKIESHIIYTMMKGINARHREPNKKISMDKDLPNGHYYEPNKRQRNFSADS